MNIYMTLAEIPKVWRSKTDFYFLVLSVRSKDLKNNRSAVYAPLIRDLKKLEDGVVFGERVLKAGVVAHLADNLEAHQVSGLSMCFSSKDICRLCHAQVRGNASEDMAIFFCNLRGESHQILALILDSTKLNRYFR